MTTKEESETVESAAPFSAEQEQHIINLFNRALTPALKTRLKGEEKFKDDILAAIAEIKSQQQPQPTETEAGTGKSKRADPELEQVRKQLETMKALVEAERAEKVQIAQAQRETLARTKLSEALRSAGVANDDLLAGASELLYKRVQFGEDGSPIMKVTREFGEEELDLAKGVAEWAKGQGKAYLPAVKANGSGQQRVLGSPARGASAMDKHAESRDRAADTILAVAGFGAMPDLDS